MMKMNTTPRKIINSFPYLPNLRVKIVFIIGKTAPIPAMIKSSDLCPQRFGFQLISKLIGMFSGNDG